MQGACQLQAQWLWQEREMAAARKKRAHQVVAKALLKAVKDLHPDEALEVLEPFYLREKSGTRRRALRAARIGLIQRSIEAPPRVIAPVAEVVPEPEPPPEVLTEPPPPKPVPKGKLLSVSLEDAAKLLFVAPTPEPEIAPPPVESSPAVEAEPEFVPMDWGAAAAGLAALDIPEDASAYVADLPVMMVAPAPSQILGLREVEVALEDTDGPSVPEEEAPAPPRRRKAQAKTDLIDLSAQFAALSDDGPAPSPGTGGETPSAALEEGLPAPGGMDEPTMAATPSLAIDPAAAFAALADEEPPALPVPKGPGMMVDPAAAFAALAAADTGASEPAAKGEAKPKPLAIDLSAQFAAMSGDEVGQKTG